MDHWLPGPGTRGRDWLQRNTIFELFGMMEVFNMIVVVVIALYTYIFKAVHLKLVNFIIC